jgi:tripartite-type tricarboxylate transporter receptor subunit TctC
MLNRRIPLIVAALAFPATVLASGTAVASVAEFYTGKTGTIIVSSGGGSYTAIARIVAPYMTKYLPGNPTFIVKNMPGAGHVLATNFMYRQAPKDGTHIATVGSAIPLHQVLDGKGVRYDARKFNWLGTTGISNQMAIIWHKAGVKTIAEARKKEVIVGATGIGAGSVIFPTILNNLIGTKFKIIIGYTNANTIDLAMERGEVESRQSYSYGSFRINHPTWEKEGKIHFLYQVGTSVDEGVPGIPLMTALAENDEQRKILQLMTAPSVLGRSYLAPPDLPADRLAALREAFAKSLSDPAFKAEMDKRGLDLYSASWERVTQLVNSIIDTPPDIVAKAKAALEVRGAVKCQDVMASDPDRCGKKKKKRKKKKKE